MHIALDILAYFVRNRQGHMKILPYRVENIFFFFPSEGSGLHIHCIIRTSICSITVKDLLCEYLFHGFQDSDILVWEITAQNVTTVSIKCGGHADQSLWGVGNIGDRNSLHHTRIKENGFESVHIQGFHTSWNPVNDSALAEVITMYSTKSPTTVTSIYPFTGKSSAWMPLVANIPSAAHLLGLAR